MITHDTDLVHPVSTKHKVGRIPNVAGTQTGINNAHGPVSPVGELEYEAAFEGSNVMSGEQQNVLDQLRIFVRGVDMIVHRASRLGRVIDREGGMVSTSEQHREKLERGGGVDEERTRSGGGAEEQQRSLTLYARTEEYTNVRNSRPSGVSSSESPLAQIPSDEPEQLRSGQIPKPRKVKQRNATKQADRHNVATHLHPPINPWKSLTSRYTYRPLPLLPLTQLVDHDRKSNTTRPTSRPS